MVIDSNKIFSSIKKGSHKGGEWGKLFSSRISAQVEVDMLILSGDSTHNGSLHTPETANEWRCTLRLLTP